MNLDLQTVLASKLALRRTLATRPPAEKMRMLDALRARELAIRGATIPSGSSAVHEGSAAYFSNPT